METINVEVGDKVTTYDLATVYEVVAINNDTATIKNSNESIEKDVSELLLIHKHNDKNPFMIGGTFKNP
jgi:hypothetical protein